MDQIALVDEQVRDGEVFRDALIRDGLPVTAAWWMSDSDGHWFLYLASPLVDQQGRKAAYEQSNRTYRRIPPQSVGPFDFKLVKTTDPAAQAVAEFSKHRLGPSRTWTRGVSLGLPVDEMLVYAPPRVP